jgi:homocysteine S-methyltransferase
MRVKKMTHSNLFRKWLALGEPILVDGAMGTMLHARGADFTSCFDALNLTRPDLVGEVHRAYIEAGARIIETNTFGANRFKLAAHGLENHVPQINAAAVEVARAAADEADTAVLVAGSVGPLGVRLAPFGRVQQTQAQEAFREQIAALVKAGVDLLLLETHSDLHEIRQAVLAARQISDLPLVASVTFTRDDCTLLGDSASTVGRELKKLGVDVIGANCSSGPAQLLRLIARMRQAAPGIPLAVMPNAGWPERVAGRIMYPATADYFGEYAQAYREAGISMIGGCCGTTPEHIASMRRALDNPVSAGARTLQIRSDDEARPGDESAQEPTLLAQRLHQGHFAISVEMDPPRGFSTHKLLAGAHLLVEAGADVINVADSPMARMRMSPWAACTLIQRQVGVETVLHFPTRGRNLLRVQGDLLAAHAVGVRNIFVVLGDPTAVGDYPEAMDNYDLAPSGLLNLIKHGFNTGVDHAGADIGGATSFFAGCALNLGAQDVGREMRVLRRKLDAGADFALTQPVFEPELARTFLRNYESEYGALEIPLLVGVLPLYSARHAAFLHNEVPGIHIPAAIRARLEAGGENSSQIGVQVAIELLLELKEIVQGAYLMPPFSRYDLAAEIIEAVRRQRTPDPGPVRAMIE